MCFGSDWDIEMERELETAEDCDQRLRQMEAKTEQYIFSFLAQLARCGLLFFLAILF